MTASRLVVWRHGQTDWNASGRYQGQADVPLNDTGRTQARAAAPELAAMEPSLLYASDLSRAVETASALAELTGLEVVTDARFREICVGDWVGLTNAEAFALDPDFELALAEGRDHRRSATGETATETGERIAAALDDVGRRAPDGSTVVVATHGLATRMGISVLLGLDHAGSQLLAGPRNCSWSILEPFRGAWRLLAYNCVAPRAPLAQQRVTGAW